MPDALSNRCAMRADAEKVLWISRLRDDRRRLGGFLTARRSARRRGDGKRARSLVRAKAPVPRVAATPSSSPRKRGSSDFAVRVRRAAQKEKALGPRFRGDDGEGASRAGEVRALHAGESYTNGEYRDEATRSRRAAQRAHAAASRQHCGPAPPSRLRPPAMRTHHCSPARDFRHSAAQPAHRRD